jgi:hypothetical protein
MLLTETTAPRGYFTKKTHGSGAFTYGENPNFLLACLPLTKGGMKQFDASVENKVRLQLREEKVRELSQSCDTSSLLKGQRSQSLSDPIPPYR